MTTNVAVDYEGRDLYDYKCRRRRRMCSRNSKPFGAPADWPQPQDLVNVVSWLVLAVVFLPQRSSQASLTSCGLDVHYFDVNVFDFSIMVCSHMSLGLYLVLVS